MNIKLDFENSMLLKDIKYATGVSFARIVNATLSQAARNNKVFLQNRVKRIEYIKGNLHDELKKIMEEN